MIYLLLNYIFKSGIIYYHIGNQGLDVNDYTISLDDVNRFNKIYKVLY